MPETREIAYFTGRPKLTKRIAQSARLLRAETRQGTDTTERATQVGELMNLGRALYQTDAVHAEEGGCGNRVQVVVLWRVGCAKKGSYERSLKAKELTWSLEHVEHALRDQEATSDVDGRDEGS